MFGIKMPTGVARMAQPTYQDLLDENRPHRSAIPKGFGMRAGHSTMLGTRRPPYQSVVFEPRRSPVDFGPAGHVRFRQADAEEERLVCPGSEWRLHRHWYENTALGDLLGADLSLAEAHRLYRCHDRLLEHKTALFTHLIARWRDLFNAQFDVLLYDLTSTYFESNPPFAEGDKRRFG